MTGHHSIGPRLREWRIRRKLTQAQLAEHAGVSARHLSFVETGRSRPSRHLVLRLARRLELSLRECNSLLAAAGLAAEYPERPISHAALETARGSIEAILEGHRPYPAFVVDRHWTLVASNGGFQPFLAGIDLSVFPTPLNVLRFTLDVRGLAPLLANYWQWRAHVFSKLARQVLVSNDSVLAKLQRDLAAYDPPPGAGPPQIMDVGSDAGFAVPFQLKTAGGVLSFFSTTTVFGTPVEVTLAEISLECFYPADDRTAGILRNTGTAALPAR